MSSFETRNLQTYDVHTLVYLLFMKVLFSGKIQLQKRFVYMTTQDNC